MAHEGGMVLDCVHGMFIIIFLCFCDHIGGGGGG